MPRSESCGSEGADDRFDRGRQSGGVIASRHRDDAGWGSGSFAGPRSSDADPLSAPDALLGAADGRLPLRGKGDSAIASSRLAAVEQQNARVPRIACASSATGKIACRYENGSLRSRVSARLMSARRGSGGYVCADPLEDRGVALNADASGLGVGELEQPEQKTHDWHGRAGERRVRVLC